MERRFPGLRGAAWISWLVFVSLAIVLQITRSWNFIVPGIGIMLDLRLLILAVIALSILLTVTTAILYSAIYKRQEKGDC